MKGREPAGALEAPVPLVSVVSLVSLVSLSERRVLQRAAAGDAEAIEALWWDWRSPIWTCLGRCFSAPRAAAGLDAVRKGLGPGLAGVPVTSAPGAVVGALLLRWIVENSDLDDVSGVSVIQPPRGGPAAGLGALPPRLRVGLLLPVLFGAPAEELARLAGQPWFAAAAERARRALPELWASEDPAQLLIEPPPAAAPRRAAPPLPLRPRAALGLAVAVAALTALAAASTEPAPLAPAADPCWQADARLLSGQPEGLRAALAEAGAPRWAGDLSAPPGWVLIGAVPPSAPGGPTAWVIERAGARATLLRGPGPAPRPTGPAALRPDGLVALRGELGLELRWSEGGDSLRLCAVGAEDPEPVEGAARWFWQRR